MATIDKTLSSTWEKIADVTQGFKLSVHGDETIALFYQDVDVAPDDSARGHVLDAQYGGAQGYQRLDTAPPGYVYARCAEPGRVTIGLTVWTI